LDSAINTIYQTFDGNELYPSLWEKAANLLYLLTKNHPFIDGNKRIAASIFLYFLNINGVLYHTDGSKLLSDGILAALTLLIAESNPTEKEMMVSIIMHYLQGYPLS
jgi:death-on-curing family protein